MFMHNYIKEYQGLYLLSRKNLSEPYAANPGRSGAKSRGEC
jgi:hypothetical protein